MRHPYNPICECHDCHVVRRAFHEPPEGAKAGHPKLPGSKLLLFEPSYDCPGCGVAWIQSGDFVFAVEYDGEAGYANYPSYWMHTWFMEALVAQFDK